MKTEHLELLQRLDNYSLNNDADAQPFVERLAREHGWPLRFAHLVIHEYKRFAFLAMAAGHPVSPSSTIDEAWHQHLLYTQSYWNEFCPTVLRAPLHHHPSRGGADERAKFANWYQRTLASYRKFFGEEPPPEIWPLQPGARAKPALAPDGYWLLRKPKWVLGFQSICSGVRTWCQLTASKIWPRAGRLTGPILLAVAVAWLLAGCSWRETPLNWRGPDFLRFFFGCTLACFVGAIFLRRNLRQSSGHAVAAPDSLEPYAATYLAGGRQLTFSAALTSLLHRGAVRFSCDSSELSTTASAPTDLHPVEQELYNTIATQPGTVVQVRRRSCELASPVAHELQRDGLIMPPTRARVAVLGPLLLALAPVALGGIKIGLGVSRGRPVELLFMSCLLVAVGALVGFARSVLRTQRGDAALAQLRVRHAPLRNELRESFSSLAPIALPLAVGLFGVSILQGTPLDEFRKKISPPAASSGCGSAGSCASDGGGGDGGGCGGGGCGGCGGGD
jgi:uncharacterized protein (TIGR04222 family)